jgi:hypothetical protein
MLADPRAARALVDDFRRAVAELCAGWRGGR